VDDRDEYEPDGEALADPVTERVRIIGAEPAGSMAGAPEPPEIPTPPPGGGSTGAAAYPDDVTGPDNSLEGRRIGADIGADIDAGPPAGAVRPPAPAPARPEVPSWLADDDTLQEPIVVPPPAPELLHWADPPTGQVPAVLDRRGDDDTDGQAAASGDVGPAWREHEHEWEDSAFDPSLLADEHTRVGALDEQPLEERQPWEFDDLGTGAARTAASAWADEAKVAVSRRDAGADRLDIAGPPSEEPWPPSAQPAAEDGPAIPPVRVRSGAAGVPSITSSPLRGSPDHRSPAAVPGARTRGRKRGPSRPGDTGSGPGRNVPIAIATGLAFAAIAVGCFEAGTVATLALSTVVVVLAAAEAFAALRRSGSHPATLLGLVATAAAMVAAYAKGVAALPLVLVLLVITSMVWYLVGAERGSPTQGVATTVLGFAWVGLLGSFAGLLLAPSQYPDRHGIAFLFGAVVATVGADVGALVIGGWRGRHPLAPRVSPRKTWEGLIGGTVLAIVASAAITGQVHPWTPGKAAVLGLVVAVVAPVGDLCESLLKRDLGLKDMGSLLPGHGGVLDRVDALLFVLPATYYLVRVLHLG
jgi:phosphatidate cytidylyltransferase